MDPYRGYLGWKEWDRASFGCCSVEDSLYFSRQLAAAGLSQLPGCRLLEIGFGDGRFAAWAIRQQALWTGTEAIPELVDAARERGWDAYQAETDLLKLPGSSRFDLVVAFDVFEHLSLDALQSMLQTLHQVLSPGGRILARVPSGDSPFGRGIQYGDLTHKLVLGSSSVRQLAESTGFIVTHMAEPVLPVFGLGFKTAARRGCVRAARAVLFPLIRKALMGGGQAVLSPNMVFVLECFS